MLKRLVLTMQGFGLFWKKFTVLALASLLIVPAATYLLSLLDLTLGVDIILIFLFAFALRVLVYALTPIQNNLIGFYFIFLSVYASGAMAYELKTAPIEGWESLLAVLDVAVVLTSISIGTRCFYEAVALKRAEWLKKG